MENIWAQRNASDGLGFVAPKYMGVQSGRTLSWMTRIEDQNKKIKKKKEKRGFFAEVNLRVRIHSREKGYQIYGAEVFEMIFKLSNLLHSSHNS